MKSLVTRFIKDESGATAIEYGLIAVVIIGAVTAIGTSLTSKFTTIVTELGGTVSADAGADAGADTD
jgi:pilus assembly protein Flp/PilA